MPLLHAAPHSRGQTRRTLARTDERSKGRKLLGIQRTRANRAPLRGEAHAHAGRRQRRGFRGTQKTFFGRADCRFAYADRIGEFVQPRHRAVGVGGRISGGKNLRRKSKERILSGGEAELRPARAGVPPPRNHRIIRSSPTRRVTRSRSRYSSNGIAYLRLTPVISLKRATSIFGVVVLSAAILWRRSVSAV